jgi:hypothetical protein
MRLVTYLTASQSSKGLNALWRDNVFGKLPFFQLKSEQNWLGECNSDALLLNLDFV